MARVFNLVQQRAFVEIKNKVLEKLGEAEAFFFENFCEDSQDGTTFDCEVLDQFKVLREVIQKSFDYGEVKGSRRV